MSLVAAPLMWWPLLGVVGGTLLVCVYVLVIVLFVAKAHKDVGQQIIGDDTYVDPPLYVEVGNPDADALLAAMEKGQEEDKKLRKKKKKGTKKMEEDQEEEESSSDADEESSLPSTASKKTEASTQNKEAAAQPAAPPPVVKKPPPPLSAVEIVYPRSPGGTMLPFKPSPPSSPSSPSSPVVDNTLGKEVEETEVCVFTPDDPNDMFRPLPYPPPHVGHPVYLRPPSTRYAADTMSNPLQPAPPVNPFDAQTQKSAFQSERATYDEDREGFYGVVNTGRPVLMGRTYHTDAGQADADDATQFLRQLSRR